ncbi:MAG: AraC family transcriptional regulator [Alistipes sp.]
MDPKTLHEVTPLSERDCFYVVERHKTEFTYPLHCHTESEFNFVEHAHRVQRIVGDSVEEIGEYDLVLITGENLEHTWSQHLCKSTQIREITVQFSPNMLPEKLLNKTQFESINNMLIKARRGLAFSTSSIMKVYHLIDNLAQQQGFYAITQFLTILYELSRSDDARILSSTTFARVNDSVDSRRIQKVCEFVSLHYLEEIRQTTLAEIAGMTPTAFSRFFSKHTSKSLSDYIIDVRLGHAIRLLVDSNHSVVEICYECGFNNLSNFNRIFKKKKGCSPKEFRLAYKKTKNII